MREVDLASMSGSAFQGAISGVQLCSMQHNRLLLVVTTSGQRTLCCLQLNDTAASQAVLTGTLAAMDVQQTGHLSSVLLSCMCYISLTALLHWHAYMFFAVQVMRCP